MADHVLKWPSLGIMVASALGVPIEWLKNTLAFHPHPVVHTSPEAYGLPYEDVWFGGADGRTLHGWYIPQRRQASALPEPLFIWFHGNAGNIAHRLPQLQLFYQQIGGSHFLFDYRGFGKSRGKPTILGILADGRDVLTLAWSRGWATGKRVVYFGESLGCAVIVELAVERPPDRIILSAPFYSLRAMGRLVLPLLAFLVEKDLNSARLIEQLCVPLLVIHGTADTTVPFQQGQDLYALAAHPKVFHTVPGGRHTDLHEVGGEAYLQVIRDFVFGSMS
ncbi:MAG TPA: alpha/beta hydrolase [Candidatus Binatia bacterium]|jgi:hypothetical protein|nr:alpha/beta hydrolase [Candidatus Binatia bacterium]